MPEQDDQYPTPQEIIDGVWRVPQHIVERNSQAHVYPQLPWNMRIPKNTDIRDIEYY